MKVVAISGWKRSGKDTAANYLVEEYGATRVAFADVLKDMVAKEYNIPRTYCDDPAFKEAALEQYPVDPQDNFTRAMVNLMFGEFRTLDGKRSEYKDYISSHINLEKLYWTPRALCILKGSVNRSVTSSFWTQKAIELIDNMNVEQETRHSGNSLFVISDLRYKSEIKQLKEAFGNDLLTIRVNRFDTCESTDPSERDLDDANFDLVVENKESVSAFLRKIEDGVGL
jgi:hypothetical protein